MMMASLGYLLLPLFLFRLLVLILSATGDNEPNFVATEKEFERRIVAGAVVTQLLLLL